ncbi:VanZ family protein [Clostridium sp. JNZ X4-2]
MSKVVKRGITLRIIWWIYIMVLFLLVVIKFHGSISAIISRIENNSLPDSINYNLIPFHSIGAQLESISEGWARYNLLGNIVPFMPFGFLLPMVFKKINSFWKVVGVGLVVDLCIEVFQYITKIGSFDVDDIILNMTGIALGYLLIKLTRIIFVREQ